MKTFSVLAPNGLTYSIDGPDDAAPEEVRARILAAHPEAETPKAKPANVVAMDEKLRAQGGQPDDPTLGGNVLRGIGKDISDKWLGTQQLVNDLSLGAIGDRKALRSEAAENERLDKPLMDTAGGMIGKYGTDLVSSFVPYGAAAKTMSLLPKASGAILGGAQKLLPAGLGGAVQEMVTPDKKYDALTAGLTGFGLGAGGEAVGRLGGRLMNPRLGAVDDPAVAEHLYNLRDVPSKLAADYAGPRSYLRDLTRALSQTPLGGGVNEARRLQAEAITEAITGAAGTPVKQARPAYMNILENKLRKEYEQFDQLGNVSLRDIPSELQPVLADLMKEARIAGTKGGPNTLRSAIEGSTEVVIPAVPSRTITTPTGGKITLQGAPAVTQPTEITAKQLLDLRSRASRNAALTTDSLTREANTAVKESLENAMFDVLPQHLRDDFRKLNAKWSTWERIQRAGVKGEGDTIQAEDYLRQLSRKRQVSPRTDLDRMVVSAERQMPTPSLVDNRALATRGLLSGKQAALGVMGAGTAGAGALFGIPGLVGAAGSLGLAHQLLGTPAGGRYLTGQASSKVGKALQSERTRELLKLLGYGAATNYRG